MALTPEEIERYKRHLVLREVGGQGQQKLKGAKVLVIGAGGLGSPVLMYLAAAGVGTLGIIDDDRVSLDTLQATEVLKEILGLGESLAGRLLLYDARATRFTEIKVTWDPANPLSGKTPTIRDLSIHADGQPGAVCAA